MSGTYGIIVNVLQDEPLSDDQKDSILGVINRKLAGLLEARTIIPVRDDKVTGTITGRLSAEPPKDESTEHLNSNTGGAP